MVKIGITGTIASGKTLAATLLRRRGMPVFNADQYGKMALHEGNECYPELVKVLGKEVLDDNQDIDAHKMAAVIFNDPQKRDWVNQIVHPFVKEGMVHFFTSHAESPLLFAEVPLLFNAHWEDEFDQICVVTCEKKTAVERMMRDRGYSREEAEKRYLSQMAPQEQMAKADCVLHNDGDRRELEQAVNQWLGKLRKETRHGTENEGHISR